MTDSTQGDGTKRCPFDHSGKADPHGGGGHEVQRTSTPDDAVSFEKDPAAWQAKRMAALPHTAAEQHAVRGRPPGTANALVPLAEGECPYADTKGPVKGDGGLWRPISRRQGVGDAMYVFSHSAHFLAGWVNQKLAPWLAPNKHIGESWPWWLLREEDFQTHLDEPGEVAKWRTFPGLMYLIAKLHFIRSGPMTDAYANQATDTKAFPELEPPQARHQIDPSGRWVSDDGRPDMAAELTRMGRNRPAMKVRPDPENVTPSAERIADKLLARRIDPETGEPIEIKAPRFSLWLAAHINKEIHGFGGLAMKLKLCCNPHRIPVDPKKGWPGNVALIDRTADDPTRTNDDGRKSPINQRVTAWLKAETYGSNMEELTRLRSFEGGKLRLGEDGLLPEDPTRPGADLTGFNNNYHVFLSLLHWLAAKEHNAIADWLHRLHPDWDDETLFWKAYRTNIKEGMIFHTPYWTGDLLQHPVQGEGMDADWWGLLGQERKMYLMRLFGRHPLLHRLAKPLRHCFVLWGMPGGKWTHHDGPHQVEVEFRLAYRVLHPLWPDYVAFHQAGTNRFLCRLGLLDIINENTRPVVQRLGYEDIAWTMVTTPCCAPALHNFPLALMKFHNFQDGELTNLAQRDVFRESHEDNLGNWNDVRAALGQHRLTDFMQAAGGDAALAAELAAVFENDIEKLDPVSGMLAEAAPPNSALKITQYIQFAKSAPRRVTNNRHMTEGHTYAEDGECMDWVEHSGGPLGMLKRHLPGLKWLMEGVVRPYSPWQPVEKFPERMMERTHWDTFKIFKSDLRTFWLAALSLGVGVWVGAVTPVLAGLILVALAASGGALEVKRIRALRDMQLCWRICHTQKRGFYFGTLYKGERWINLAASLGRLQAKAVLVVFALLAWGVHGAHPWVAVLLVLAGLSGFKTRKLSNKFASDALVLKIALRRRMREGQPKTDAATLPGGTPFEKRYWLLQGKNERPVATYESCMDVLQHSGLTWWDAWKTTVRSLLKMGKKTQKGMTWRQKRENGIGLFFDWSIYLPNLDRCIGDVGGTRIFATAGNTKGLQPGEIDMAEFREQCDRYAPGRDHFTAYDFRRMGEGNRVRAAREGVGNLISRWFGQKIFKLRTDPLIPMFADEVVAEVHKLVPAISHDEMLRIYDGSAWADLIREHRQGDNDPSPIGRPGELDQLSEMSAAELAKLYSECDAGVVPGGESQGRAFVMKGTLRGWFFSRIANLVWKGKVVGYDGGDLPCYLINKILGRQLVVASVNYGPSWFDGKQSIIIDYKQTSWLAFFIRDEIRQIQPGFFGGFAYVRLPFGFRWNALYFALDFRK